MSFIDFDSPQYRLPSLFGNRVIAPLINENLKAINYNSASACSASFGYFDHSLLPTAVDIMVRGDAERKLKNLQYLEEQLEKLGITPGVVNYFTNGTEALVLKFHGVQDTLLKIGCLNPVALQKFHTDPRGDSEHPSVISDFVLSPHYRHMVHDTQIYMSFVPYLDGELSEFAVNNDPAKKKYKELVDKTITCLRYEGLEVTDPKKENWGYSSMCPNAVFLLDIGAVKPLGPTVPRTEKPIYYDEMVHAAIEGQERLHHKRGYGLEAALGVIEEAKMGLPRLR